MNFSTSAHLGDCLFALSALRKLGGEHTFYCNTEYVPDLSELMNDTQVSVRPLGEASDLGIDVWIANAAYEADGIVWQNQRDIMGYVMDYFNALGMRHFGKKAFMSRKDMLWDSQSIIEALPTVPHPRVLVINSDPLSGQCPYYSRDRMAHLVMNISRDYSGCVATNVQGRPNYTLAQIGAMSLTAKLIISVANGPMWPTWTRWNPVAQRFILLENMVLDFGTGCPIKHFSNVDQIMEEMNTLVPYV